MTTRPEVTAMAEIATPPSRRTILLVTLVGLSAGLVVVRLGRVQAPDLVFVKCVLGADPAASANAPAGAVVMHGGR